MQHSAKINAASSGLSFIFLPTLRLLLGAQARGATLCTSHIIPISKPLIEWPT